ncbi:MAG TPA: methyltransferase domain-containing protein [Candidatus Bathyarchaeia archaeon]|nr:methyltransferase domain-containing protein [Candidatus Bathyarchaeia archaeon]
MTASRQETYYHVYRNRQSWLYHLAYMRLAKVLGVLHALERQGVDLQGKRVFDYGFGAGTFFRHCPRTALLFGVELDALHVERVARSLRAKKYPHVDLRAIDEAGWRDHALLVGRYNVVVASHVLEHVKAPVELLKRLTDCVEPGGCLVAVLPINERVGHDSHEWVVDTRLVQDWAAAAGVEIIDAFEFDPFTYCALPVFEKRSRCGRVAAQGLSLFLGFCAAAIGRRGWLKLGGLVARSTGAKPGQAVFTMQPVREKN